MPTQHSTQAHSRSLALAPTLLDSAELDRQRLAAVLARALAAWCQTHYADDPALRLEFPTPVAMKAAA